MNNLSPLYKLYAKVILTFDHTFGQVGKFLGNHSVVLKSFGGFEQSGKSGTFHTR